MEVKGEVELRPPGFNIFAAFAVLAILAGPAKAYADSYFSSAPLPTFAAVALSSMLAGCLMCAVAGSRRSRPLSGPQWRGLLLLLLPQSGVILLGLEGAQSTWMHAPGRGAELLVSFAAPLWLGLISALDIVKVEAPRAAVAGAIAGIGAGLLVLPVESYALGWNQALAFMLDCLLGIAMVISWTVARPRLRGVAIAQVAGDYLLMSAVGYAILSFVFERAMWQALEWKPVALSLAVHGLLLFGSWWLWFWLFRRLTLAAFGMRALAAWVATLAPGFALFGLRDWRMDVAFLGAIASLVVALRARTGEEQPLSLGLADS